MREFFNNAALLWLRFFVGAGIAYHGYGKVFGGYMPKMAEGIAALGFPQPVFFAWAAALSELVGGTLLVLGFGTRLAALFVWITMSVAAFMQHAQDPLKVKELALAYWAASGFFFLAGAGKFSVDAFFRKSK